MESRPFLALTLGDPAGIGPEVVLDALRLASVRRCARLLLIGHPETLSSFREQLGEDAPRQLGDVLPEASLPDGSVAAGALTREVRARLPLEEADAVWLGVNSPAGWTIGKAQAAGGRAALAALRVGAALAQQGVVDGLVTAPVSKEALHMAGEECEGQTELLGRWAGTPELQMLAVAKQLRVLLLTRHLPLKDALQRIEPELVLRHLRLLQDGLRSLGFDAPRLALAGLNPHAGEAGILGSEEQDLLEPALRIARAEGLTVAGPESPDTVFLRASRGHYDGVLALYHDQAFIPVKLHAPDEGLTVLLGLPYLRVSPAHGTAFDIAGQGLAKAENLVTAILQAAEWAGRRRVDRRDSEGGGLATPH